MVCPELWVLAGLLDRVGSLEARELLEGLVPRVIRAALEQLAVRELREQSALSAELDLPVALELVARRDPSETPDQLD